MSKRSGFANNSGKRNSCKEMAIAVQNHFDIKRKRKIKERQRKSWFLRTIKFECQLYRDNSKYPAIKKMTCSQMGLFNKAFIIEYGTALDKYPDPKLWKWKIIDVKKFKTMRDAYIFETT